MAPRKLKSIDTQALEAELKRRRRLLPALERKRKRLQTQIRRVESELRELGAVAGGNGSVRGVRRRPRNEMSLAQAIEKVLKPTQPMSVGEVMDAVGKVGYRSNAENFRTIVNQTLLREKQFKKKGRGQYVLATGKR